MDGRGSVDDRVLVHLPTARDGERTRAALAAATVAVDEADVLAPAGGGDEEALKEALREAHCVAIADAEGTPLYVYSAAALRERFRALDDAFDGYPHALHYALKANSNLSLGRLLQRLGDAQGALRDYKRAVELDEKYGAAYNAMGYALLALMCCYGIELLPDNIAECRANMLEVFAEYLNLTDDADETYRAAFFVLSLNLVHGDAMTMRDMNSAPISVVEWAYLGKGKFQRRDFRLDVLTGMASFSAEGSLFAHLGKHEIFMPTNAYPPMALRDLVGEASSETGGAV